MRLHLLLLLGVCRLVAALDSNGIFSHPPKAGPVFFHTDNIILTLGDTEELKWSTGKGEYSLHLWQQNRAGGAGMDGTEIFTKERDDSEPGGISWDVQTYGFDLDDSPIFFLGIGFDGTENSGFTSHYFNITRRRPDSTSSSSSSSGEPTPSETPPPAATDDADRDADRDAASSTSDPRDPGPDLGLSLGLGLGLGIPLAALIGGIMSYIILKKRSKKRAMKLELENAKHAQPHAGWYTPETWSQSLVHEAMDSKPTVVHEAMDTSKMAELPGNHRG